MNETNRWLIYRILRFPESLKTPLWTRIDTKSLDLVWSSQVIDILDRMVAGETNPMTLVGSTEDYDPGLKKLDIIEYYQGVAEATYKEIYDRLWLDLATLIGRDELFATIASTTTSSTTGRGHGFS